MSDENELLTTAKVTLENKALNRELITKQEIKAAKRKGFKRGVVISGAGAAILLVLLL